MPISINNTTLTFNDATTQTTAGQPGTVTSVATGNGLSGGTITTTGTLTVACPTANTVGSYAMIGSPFYGPSFTTTFGTNYATGTGGGQMQAFSVVQPACDKATLHSVSSNISGTWKYLGASLTDSASRCGVGCRVS